MNHTPEYYQSRQPQQEYRASAPTASTSATKRVTPFDGEEQWYLDGGVSNRMTLSLLSGIPKEINWALSRLVNLSDEHNARFVLATVPKLTEAIFYAPVVYLTSYREARESFAPFVAPRKLELERKHATESMLVLRNASHNDLNVTHLAQDPRTVKIINDIIGLPPHEANVELMVYAFELLQVLAHHLPLPSKGKHPFGNVPFAALEEIVSTSVDRTLIIHSLTALTLFMTPIVPPGATSAEPLFPPPYAPPPNSPALARGLHFLALVQDQLLLTNSLEFLAAYLTSLPATQAFLQSPKLTKTLRLLVGVLRYDQRTEMQTVRLGPPIRSTESKDEWLPYELSDEELARIAPMPEPERSFQWMNKMFENAPGAEQTQVTFWTLYKDTFTPYSDYPMLQAADIIRNVTIEFPEASASVVDGGAPGAPQRFVIQNIRRRLKPPSPHRFRCQWNGGAQCTENRPNSPEQLYNHIISVHLQESDGAPNSCRWASCTHETPNLAVLRQHVTTHIPASAPAPKNPCQPHAITLPYADPAIANSYTADTMPAGESAGAVPQPAPPPPASIVKFRGAPDAQREPPSQTALLALYSLRMLFWASFADDSSATPVHDEDRFGFPTLPSIERDLEKEQRESGGEEVREAARIGRRAFRSICSSLAEVHVGDPEIMWWVVDMMHRAQEGADLPSEQPR